MYAEENDPLCYPGTTVLINKANLTDQEKLDEFETAMTLTRWEEPWPVGAFSEDHYKQLHHHFFQDIYAWAGECRTIRISKDNSLFCYPEHINENMNKFFAALKDEVFLTNYDKDEFSAQAAHYLGELNAIHAFRDGNGRTQMSLLILLCKNANHPINLAKLQPERFMPAMIESFSSRPVKLTSIINDMIHID